MQEILMYLSVFFMVFFSCAIMGFCFRLTFWIFMEYRPQRQEQHRQHIRHVNNERSRNRGALVIIIVFACLGYHTYMAIERNGLNIRNRQANTLADERSRDNRFNDIFFIEPNSAEAARIRAQLEKDDKDLPSYEEVMRMTNLATPTAAPATNSAFVPAISASSHSIATSSTSINTTDTTLTVPPNTETNVNISSTSANPRPLTPPPYSPEPPAADCVVLPITTPLHTTTTQSS